MKIKKKNTTIPISGKIVDTENVEDKTSNAPSLRLLEEKLENINNAIQQLNTNLSTVLNKEKYIFTANANGVLVEIDTNLDKQEIEISGVLNESSKEPLKTIIYIYKTSSAIGIKTTKNLGAEITNITAKKLNEKYYIHIPVMIYSVVGVKIQQGKINLTNAVMPS